MGNRKIEDAFSFLDPMEIKDPAASKPEDWVDQKKIPDPTDVKSLILILKSLKTGTRRMMESGSHQ